MTLPFRYEVTFAHRDETKPDSDPNKHGWGKLTYDSENEVKTDQDLKDVARWIGHEYGFTAVGITKIDRVFDYDDIIEVQGG